MAKQAHRMTLLRGEHQVQCQTSECETLWQTQRLHADYVATPKQALPDIPYTLYFKEIFKCFLSQKLNITRPIWPICLTYSFNNSNQ